MIRYFLAYFLFFIAMTVMGQKGEPAFISFTGKFRSKNLVDISTTSWEIGMKGLKSMTLSFDKGDTIVYTISRERKREATFSLSDFDAVLIERKFYSNILFDTVAFSKLSKVDVKKPSLAALDSFLTDKKNHSYNVISGGFVASGQGTYIFKIKNHSFLGNKFSIDLKKTVIPPKVEKIPLPDTVYVYKDSLVNVVDSTVYLACTLNLNQPQEFSIPYKVDKKQDCTLINSVDVALMSTPANGENSSRKNILLHRTYSTISSVPQGDLIIYLYDYTPEVHFLDSLKNTTGKGRELSMITLNGTKSAPQTLLVKNEDKVVGKYIHIQLIEIRKVKRISKINNLPVKNDK